MVAWVTFPLCMGLMVVAKDLVWVALTDAWMGAVPIIQVLSLYAMIRSMAVLLPPVLMARYRPRFLFGYNLALLGVMPLAFWLGAVWWGPVGAAMAWVTVYPLLMLRMAREALHEVSTSWKSLWAELWPPSLATPTARAGVILFVALPPRNTSAVT